MMSFFSRLVSILLGVILLADISVIVFFCFLSTPAVMR